MNDDSKRKDLKLTREKWSESYKDDLEKEQDIDVFDMYIKANVNLVEKFRKEAPISLFLEAGCGTARTSLYFAKKNANVIGLDISIEALKLAKRIFKNECTCGDFVCGDILHMPFKDGIFDAIFGGGSIEHFEDTHGGVREVFRVLSRNGVFLAEVPVVSLSTLIYYQFTGQIPNIPLIRSLTKFIHFKLLKGRYMEYGYEKSFTKSGIQKIFRTAGFSKVESGLFDVEYPVHLFKNMLLKSALRKIAHFRLFWPMIYVKGEKHT